MQSRKEYSGYIGLLNGVAVSLVVIALYDYLKRAYCMLSIAELLELAENENLVLINSLRNLQFSSLSEMINFGQFPIYPDLFHHIASYIPVNSLISGRLVSILAQVGISVSVVFFGYIWTRKFWISVLLPTIFWGAKSHGVFFDLCRVDGLLLFFGTLSVLLAFDLNRSAKSSSNIVLSGTLAALAICTKQSGLFYLAVHLFYLFFSIFILKKWDKRQARRLVVLDITVISTILVIALSLSPMGGEGFLFGLRLYANDIDFKHVFTHAKIFLEHLQYPILLCSAVVVLILNYSKQKMEVLGFLVLILLTLSFSIRLWGNIGAVYNNFILLSSIPILIMAAFYSKASYPSKMMILFSFLASSIVGQIVTKHPPVCSILAKNELVGQGVRNSTLNYSPSDRILTDRVDHWLLDKKIQIRFEGSVLIPIFKGQVARLENRTQDMIHELWKSTELEVRSHGFSVIITGINEQAMVDLFSISKYYRPKISFEYTILNHSFPVTVHEPK